MALPTLLVRYSTDDADDPTPFWVDVTDDVRSFSVSRGRDSELGEIGPGTATLVMNNRQIVFDPITHGGLKPMNRWNIRAVLSASTEDVFYGYAESYEQQWPGLGHDAITVVSCVDEFKVLQQDALPATDPPRESYQELCMFDEPRWYLPMGDVSTGMSVAAAVGEGMTAVTSCGSVSGAGAIVGQELPGYTFLTQSGYLRTQPIGAGHELDPGGLTEFTVECWFQRSGSLPASGYSLIRGPTAGASTWSLEIRTDGKIEVVARNSGGTVHTVTGTTVLAADTFYHLVATITGATLRLYVNGTQEASTAWTGAFASVTTASVVTIGNNGASISTRTMDFDEVAFYRTGLTAARVTAHYNAGVNRGFVRNVEPGDRVDDILDAATSVAARSVRTGTRNMTGAYMTAQPPLQELRQAALAEAPDGMLFIAKDGTITFLDNAHRSASPWNTVQATFDDDGTDHPYVDISIDYSDSFITNEWNLTRAGGLLTTDDDATSIAEFGKRSQSLNNLPVLADADVTTIAAALVAKYKDPISRITSLGVLTHPNATAEAVLPLDLGDRIRVRRTDALGGVIDQTLFIQKIDVQGAPGKPWQIRLGVSPL